MKKLILIGGDLAAGKSTFSNRLSKKFKITCFNKDNIKEILGDNFGFKNREENYKLSKATFDLFKYLAEKQMYTKEDLILESNFRNHELEYLNELANRYNYKIVTIVLNAEIKELHQRFMDRINGQNRHIVHKSVDYSDYKVFEKQILSDRDRKYFGKVIKLQTNNFKKLYSDKTFEIIKKAIDEE